MVKHLLECSCKQKFKHSAINIVSSHRPPITCQSQHFTIDLNLIAFHKLNWRARDSIGYRITIISMWCLHKLIIATNYDDRWTARSMATRVHQCVRCWYLLHTRGCACPCGGVCMCVCNSRTHATKNDRNKRVPDRMTRLGYTLNV